MSKEDKVERLENLLSKSIAYSEFLANKLKDGEDVKDGKVTGKKLSQPKLIQGEMRPYQLIGVHWLVGLYENGLNGILGDEMGLGKTVESIAMLAHLSGQGVSGPGRRAALDPLQLDERVQKVGAEDGCRDLPRR